MKFILMRSNANFNDANLRGVTLNEANLKYATLSNATLSNANLSDANLSGANLTNAKMEGANLTNANLKGANLNGADLMGIQIDKKALSTNKSLLAKNEKKEGKRKAKQEKIKKEKMLALQKKREKEKAELPKNELGLFYQTYAGLKKCYEVRKGYELVHVNSVEMANIKSKAKSIENGILGKYPKVKPMKDEIWNKSTRMVSETEVYQATLAGKYLWGVPPITTNLSHWQEVCNDYKTLYTKLINMYGGGGTTEKDF